MAYVLEKVTEAIIDAMNALMEFLIRIWRAFLNMVGLHG